MLFVWRQFYCMSVTYLSSMNHLPLDNTANFPLCRMNINYNRLWFSLFNNIIHLPRQIWNDSCSPLYYWAIFDLWIINWMYELCMCERHASEQASFHWICIAVLLSYTRSWSSVLLSKVILPSLLQNHLPFDGLEVSYTHTHRNNTTVPEVEKLISNSH